jgi:hypothetical protein
MNNPYMKELQELKSWDTVESIEPVGRGYNKIYTCGHGYLVVPKNDTYAKIAKKLCEYGFVGKLAYYLEEDCEAPAFMKAV